MKKTQKRKCYQKQESPLYLLKSPRKLAKLLKIEIEQLESLVSKDSNYKVYPVKKGTDSERVVQEPKEQLKYLHKKLFKFLQRIETPNYLHSGVSGRSYITNAKVHCGEKGLLTLDIRGFFKNTKAWQIHKFFHQTMKCDSDVAGILAKLCTYNKHVPTGSSLSQAIAFFANEQMFNEIDDLAKGNNINFTCYVDDLTLSGDSVGRNTLYKIRGIFQKYGMESHPEKEHLYKSKAPRKVTGSIIKGDRLFLPNSKHREIYEKTQTVIQSPDNSNKLIELDRLIGKVIAASSADENFLKQLKKLRGERKRLTVELSKIKLNDDAIYLYTDGGSRGNPGPSSIGIVIKSNKGDTIEECAEKIGYSTNNQAEYKALIKGLEVSIKKTKKRLICFSDSKILVNQMNGTYKVKNAALKKLYFIAKGLTKKFESIEFRHVPRTDVGIKQADKLLNKAYNL